MNKINNKEIDFELWNDKSTRIYSSSEIHVSISGWINHPTLGTFNVENDEEDHRELYILDLPEEDEDGDLEAWEQNALNAMSARVDTIIKEVWEEIPQDLLDACDKCRYVVTYENAISGRDPDPRYMRPKYDDEE
jgi:hypothetical protein